MPMGADLYGGLAGQALFLAYLGAVTEETRYTNLAREALTALRRRVERERTFADMAWGWAQPVRVRELAEIGQFPGTRVALSRDGTRAATIAGDQVAVWDVSSGDAMKPRRASRISSVWPGLI